jgi:hypothetical protein
MMCAYGTAADTSDTRRISPFSPALTRQTDGKASAAIRAASAEVRASKQLVVGSRARRTPARVDAFSPTTRTLGRSCALHVAAAVTPRPED